MATSVTFPPPICPEFEGVKNKLGVAWMSLHSGGTEQLICYAWGRYYEIIVDAERMVVKKVKRTEEVKYAQG